MQSMQVNAAPGGDVRKCRKEDESERCEEDGREKVRLATVAREMVNTYPSTD